MGCTMGGTYVGVVGYADDLILLAPCRDAASEMLKTCEDFTKENNIEFSVHEDPTHQK